MAEDERLGLENLSPPEGSKPDTKRVGRGPGSGRGKTSGRGHKGQKARSGGQIPIWFEGGQMPLYRRIPKRGFTPWNRTETQIVNLRDFHKLSPGPVGPEELHEAGLIESLDEPVKILGEGDVEAAYEVRAHAFSESAAEKIREAGGSVERIE